MQFIRNLQACYEADYANIDHETIEQALQMMQTAVEEHADRFHELFDDDDDPELAANVSRALHTMGEMGAFFGIDADDDIDIEDLEFDLGLDFDDDEDDDEEDEDDDE